MAQSQPSSSTPYSSHETAASSPVGANASRSRANTQNLQLPYVPGIQRTASHSPPPPYTHLPPVNSGGLNSIPYSHSNSQGVYGPDFGRSYFSTGFPGTPYAPPNGQHQHFGPTPLSTAVPLLTYARYEPPEVADRRARRRFWSSVGVTLGVCLLAGAIVGLELLGETTWW